MRNSIRKSILALLLGSALAVLSPSASAVTTTDFGQYSVTYDETTTLGGISFSSGGGGAFSFGWNLPTSASVFSTSGLVITEVALPTLVLTANAGYVLGGPIGISSGALVYSEFGGGGTAAILAGSVSIDGSPSVSFSIPLDKGPITPVSGAYAIHLSQPFGSFNTLTFGPGGKLLLGAETLAGGVASITSQPQNQYSVSFAAAAVPEPENYMLLLVGLGFILTIVGRRGSV